MGWAQVLASQNRPLPEFSRRSRRAWLRCANGSPLIALVGKVLPLAALFFAFLGIETLILHAGFELPYRGYVLMMVVAAMLFIAAYQSLAALLLLLVRNLALGLSFVAIIASPAFGYAGVRMPVLANEYLRAVLGCVAAHTLVSAAPV